MPDYFGSDQLRARLGWRSSGASDADAFVLDHCRVTLRDLAREARKEIAQMNPAEVVPL